MTCCRSSTTREGWTPIHWLMSNRNVKVDMGFLKATEDVAPGVLAAEDGYAFTKTT